MCAKEHNQLPAGDRGLRFFQPESVISVMMIITYIFEQMFCRFEGAMGLHCNREATRQMTKRWLY